MEEKDEGKKKKLDKGAQWHSGILACASEPKTCLLGCCFPCLLYGMAKAEVEESLPQNAMALLMGGARASPCASSGKTFAHATPSRAQCGQTS
eukprot:CAMPEP_0114175298 /NCGR_PEP_ID=MMETSP0043_2-20121206/36891_1 /TAXON_ID=464988 /ORGANISM="Hemiselmis andersenii, Strain CCMP644" /LENGTH=92 /DNA_ID=CAMNT_0001273545 /DNA_START=334 /DNA_END=610 /DNA_ORIENTATION=-